MVQGLTDQLGGHHRGADRGDRLLRHERPLPRVRPALRRRCLHRALVALSGGLYLLFRRLDWLLNSRPARIAAAAGEGSPGEDPSRGSAAEWSDTQEASRSNSRPATAFATVWSWTRSPAAAGRAGRRAKRDWAPVREETTLGGDQDVGDRGRLVTVMAKPRRWAVDRHGGYSKDAAGGMRRGERA
jgi:hypothetical protein